MKAVAKAVDQNQKNPLPQLRPPPGIYVCIVCIYMCMFI